MVEKKGPILPSTSDDSRKEGVPPLEEKVSIITEQSIVKYKEDFNGKETIIVATFGDISHWEKAVEQLERTVERTAGFLTGEERSKNIEFCVFPLRESIAEALIGLKEGENVIISAGGACDCEILKILQPKDD